MRTVTSLLTGVDVMIPEPLAVLPDEAESPVEGHDRIWCIPSVKDGDVKVSWDSGDEEDEAAAQKLFELLRDEGMDAYYLTREGALSANKMVEFDPDAKQVVFMPTQMVGGG